MNKLAFGLLLVAAVAAGTAVAVRADEPTLVAVADTEAASIYGGATIPAGCHGWIVVSCKRLNDTDCVAHDCIKLFADPEEGKKLKPNAQKWYCKTPGGANCGFCYKDEDVEDCLIVIIDTE